MITAGFILAIIVILITVPTAFLGTDCGAFIGDILGVILLTALFAAGIAIVVGVVATLIKALAFLWPLLIVGFFASAIGGGK